MSKPPKKPKDPAKPTRAKASRPDNAPTPDALADLLNPAIGKGTAGLGSGTGKNSGLQQPPDNSFDRRRDFSDAHNARKSARKSMSKETPQQEGFGEAPQSNFSADFASRASVTGLDPQLANELGLGDDDTAAVPARPAGKSIIANTGCRAPTCRSPAAA